MVQPTARKRRKRTPIQCLGRAPMKRIKRNDIHQTVSRKNKRRRNSKEIEIEYRKCNLKQQMPSIMSMNRSSSSSLMGNREKQVHA